MPTLSECRPPAFFQQLSSSPVLPRKRTEPGRLLPTPLPQPRAPPAAVPRPPRLPSGPEEDAALLLSSQGPPRGLPAPCERLGWSLGWSQSHVGFSLLPLLAAAWGRGPGNRRVVGGPGVCHSFLLCRSFKALLRSSSSMRPALIPLPSQWLLLASASSVPPLFLCRLARLPGIKEALVNAHAMKACGGGGRVGDTPP